ncbi:uncharacterized protein TRIVIDRAFT_219767 [Trichoderma virens Gv29-8]|uniref:Uncharacterized protein n=1 Tax=Hypocrea virens (strain Gv29-8 / FGSC 10586) TaxID=413071 RepID=G9MLT5_HYPVG|nr:uncharacterized protein TRIVIDRAFT_219767 [Trichoderma virens Gv29-8]EHK24309.1 hypothetical protein TRIVIDRAFT_219767 [Trichoderma virens Gv29-8]UKZ54577.1 hypothetical protein TrVGV298_008386 [Trichoderma virens]
MASTQLPTSEVKEVRKVSNDDDDEQGGSSQAEETSTGDTESDTSVISDEAEAMSKAMGRITDKLQSQLNIPKVESGKSSVGLYYNVAAQATVELQTDWEIIPGLNLQGVKLRTKIAKTSKQPVTLGVELNAFLLIKDYTVIVSGTIPRIQKGRDIEFTLKLKASSCLGSIDTDGIIEACTKDNGNGPTHTKACYQDLLQKTGLQNDMGDAAMAELTIVREAQSEEMYLKKFEIHIAANIDWQIIPGKLRLQKAAALLRFSKKKREDSLLTRLELAGSIILEDPPETTIGLQAFLSLKDGDVRLALACNVAAMQAIQPSHLVNLITEQENTDMSLDSVGAPPDLGLPHDNFWSFDLFAALERKQAEWSLQYVRVAVEINQVWAPLPELVIGDLKGFLMGFRPDLDVKDFKDDTSLDRPGNRERLATLPKEIKTESNSALPSLEVSGWIIGTVYLGSTWLQATVQHDAITKVTQVHCYIDDTQICSLTQIVSNPRLHSLQSGQSAPSEEDFTKALALMATPATCPVDFWLVSALGYGTQRQCSISIEGSKLQRLTFSVMSAGDANAWQPTDTIHLQDMGLSISYEPSKSSTAGFGNLKGYAYGHLKLSNGLTLFGLVVGRKESKIGEFMVHLSTSLQPNAGLGVTPENLFADPILGSLTPKTEGWELPSSFLADEQVSFSRIFQSAEAGVTLKFSRDEIPSTDEGTPSYQTALRLVHVYLDLQGNWEIFSGLKLQDVRLLAIISPKATAQGYIARIEVTGVFHATTPGVSLAVSARFGTQGPVSLLTARLTGAVNASTRENHSSAALPLMPTRILELSAFQDFRSTSMDEISVPDDFPVTATRVMSSTQTECEMKIDKDPSNNSWKLTRITFSLTSDAEWTVIPDLLRIRLQLLALQLPRSTENPCGALALAAANIWIGNLELTSKLIFCRNNGRSDLIFTISAGRSEMKEMVSKFTEESFSTMTPSKISHLADSACFDVQALCVWEKRNSVDSSRPWFRELTVKFGSTASIDLEFMQLGELSLSIERDEGTKRFSINSCVVFFGELHLKLSLAYRPATAGKSSCYSGSLTLPSQPKPFVTITHQNGHWGLKDWYISEKELKTGIQFDEAIEKATQKYPSKCECKKLVGFFLKEIIMLRFSWKITKPESSEPMFKDNQLHLRIVWSFKISFSALEHDLSDFDMPDLPLHVPGPFRLSEFHKLLVNTIRETVADIGQKILERPVDFAKIMAAVSVKHFGHQIISSLICRLNGNGQEVSSNLKERDEELTQEEARAAEEEPVEDENPLEQGEGTEEPSTEPPTEPPTGPASPSVLDAAKIAGSAAGSAAAAGAGGASDLAVALVLGATASVLLGWLGTTSTDHNIDESGEPGKRTLLVNLNRKIERGLTMRGTPHCQLHTGRQVLEIGWRACTPAIVDDSSAEITDTVIWTVRIQDSTGQEVYATTIPAAQRSVRYQIPGQVCGEKLRVQVRASLTYKGQAQNVQFNGPWSPQVEVTWTAPGAAPTAPARQQESALEIPSANMPPSDQHINTATNVCQGQTLANRTYKITTEIGTSERTSITLKIGQV